MRRNLTLACVTLVLALGISSCSPYVGSRLYPGAPHFANTHPDHVMLIKHKPKKRHIELGDVWIRPEPWMDRYFVEYKLRKKAAKMGAHAVVIIEDEYYRDRTVYRYYRGGTMIYGERFIGGVAIRF